MGDLLFYLLGPRFINFLFLLISALDEFRQKQTLKLNLGPRLPIHTLQPMNKQLQEILAPPLTPKHQMNVPLLLEINRYTIPSKKSRLFHELFLIQQQNVLPQHPESRCVGAVGEVLNIIQIETGIGFLEGEVVHPIRVKIKQLIVFKLDIFPF